MYDLLVKIRDLILHIKGLTVNSHLHMAKYHLGTRLQKSLLKNLMKMCRSEYFWSCVTQTKQVLENTAR